MPTYNEGDPAMTSNFNPAWLAAALQGDHLNAQVAATPGGIEIQEACGQAEFVVSETLPAQGTIRPTSLGQDNRERWAELGVTFGKQVDALFVEANLPAGWQKKASPDHSMWSYLHDAEGNEVARIFYKAAFYDQRASINFSDG